ncbi:FtsX-like permease family protein [Lysinibacillus sp. KU-BSD001]|uniref:ABC transporter permease n=1 Tax=Lysinibacillus sp. KU-BSD001 TaxID=3141328 RepID=UPI0036E30AA5
MLFKDQLQFVWQHMKKNKLRVTTTVLAAMIGCAFLIVLASIGFGIQDTMRNELLNQEEITEIQLWGEESLSAEDEQWINNLEHVNVVLKKADISGVVQSTFEDRTGHSQGIIVDMDAQAKLPSNLSAGRLPQTANEIVVGYHYAQSLLNEADEAEIERKAKEAEANGTWYNGEEEGYKGDILGKEIVLTLTLDEDGTLSEPTTFTVVGILKAPSYEWYQDTSIQFGQDIMTTFPQLMTYPSSRIYVDSLEHVMPVLTKLKEQGYQVYSVVEQLEEMDLFFLIFKIGLVFIGTIAVLIASIGIFNTMTMAVTERTREIGVLKAIGASPALIQRLFLMESAFIGLLGTSLAIIVSYAISFSANAILPHVLAFALSDADLTSYNITFSTIPLSLVVIAGSISLLVAILSGWRPARKATKIEVIHALRQEL